MSKLKRYRGKKTRTKTQGPDIEVYTNSKGRYSDLEGYVFNLGPISLDKPDRTMKDI